MVEEKKDRIPPAENDDEPFLVRWSRRKQAVRQEQESPGEESGDTQLSDSTETGVEAADDQSFTDEDLPPPESLGPDSDFSAYLSARVSSGLRRAAMRRLFSLPGFNIRDGLDDYDEDYTNFQSLGKIVTAQMKYQARRLQERERDRQNEENERLAGDSERVQPAVGSAGDSPRTTSDSGTDVDSPDTGIDTAAHDDHDDHDDDPDDRS